MDFVVFSWSCDVKIGGPNEIKKKKAFIWPCT